MRFSEHSLQRDRRAPLHPRSGESACLPSDLLNRLWAHASRREDSKHSARPAFPRASLQAARDASSARVRTSCAAAQRRWDTAAQGPQRCSTSQCPSSPSSTGAPRATSKLPLTHRQLRRRRAAAAAARGSSGEPVACLHSPASALRVRCARTAPELPLSRASQRAPFRHTAPQLRAHFPAAARTPRLHSCQLPARARTPSAARNARAHAARTALALPAACSTCSAAPPACCTSSTPSLQHLQQQPELPAAQHRLQRQGSSGYHPLASLLHTLVRVRRARQQRFAPLA